MPATFYDLPCSDDDYYVPAFTLRAGNGVSVNFGSAPFRYKPDGFAALGVSDSWCARMDAHYANESRRATAQRHDVLRRLWHACSKDDASGSGGSGSADVPRMYRCVTAAVDAYCESTGKHYSQITEAALHAYLAKQPDARAATRGNDDDGDKDGGDKDGGGEAAAVVAPQAAWQLLAPLSALTRIAQAVLPFVRVHTTRAQPWCGALTPLLLRVRDVLFAATRHSLVDAALRETAVRVESRRVFVNRARARAQPGVLAASVFGQTLALLAHAPARMWRSSKRLWNTTFLGEGAEDAGGPYREHLYEMCRELMSTSSTTSSSSSSSSSTTRRALFVPTANHVHNTGTHREAYVPAAAATDASARVAFAFVGKLMGAALRSEEPLSLFLPPLVWRYLCRCPLVEADLLSVDVIFVQCLRELRALCDTASSKRSSRSSSSSSNANTRARDDDDDDAAARAAFDDVFDTQYFVTRRSDHSVVELVPGGATQKVTYARRGEYAAALLHARLHEYDVQLEAMRQGMLCVVPELVLLLLTPEELERRVCGQADYSVDALRKTTVYEGLAADDRRVALLWRALEEATAVQRRLFLRFVAGRDRLPVKLRVLPYTTDLDPDRAFPRATTCFFAIELPDYSSLATMKQRLYYSIENCIDMDADFNARATDEHEGPHLTVGTDDNNNNNNLDNVANLTLQEL